MSDSNSCLTKVKPVLAWHLICQPKLDMIQISPQAEGEVGKVGVSITSIKDMMTAFDGIPLGKVSSSMTINSTASTLLAYYIAVGEAQGFKSHELRGTTQNDILKEYIARNTYIYPPEHLCD